MLTITTLSAPKLVLLHESSVRPDWDSEFWPEPEPDCNPKKWPDSTGLAGSISCRIFQKVTFMKVEIWQKFIRAINLLN